MSNKKKISEKTFELNITNELLNLSKSFILGLNRPKVLSELLPEDTLRKFLPNKLILAEGLSQLDEAKKGYDVSLNLLGVDGVSDRVLFLQYKSGKLTKFSRNKDSIFDQSKTDTEHISFGFNNDSKKEQHVVLKRYSESDEVNEASVMYVFPRITDTTEYYQKAQNLLEHCSFVPVCDIDKQGKKQDPKIYIKKGKAHKYRTTSDGNNTEVNYYYYGFPYDQKMLSKILGELICVQLERLEVYARQNGKKGLIPIFDMLPDLIEDSLLTYSKNQLIDYRIIMTAVRRYFSMLNQNNNKSQPPLAPQLYTVLIGSLKKDKSQNESDLSCQIF